MNSLKRLHALAKNFTLLYVEDNNALRKKAAVLLGKFFGKVDLAKDGQEGLEKFKRHHYSIVITDIRMPKMDGIDLVKQIKHLQPDTKVIIMSAFDDKELLFKGIEIGIFRFLTKPVDVMELSTVLVEALEEIKHERSVQLFYTHLENLFNYQSSMVVMLQDGKVILANQMFLDFFQVSTIEEFHKHKHHISEFFLPSKGFLYNCQKGECLTLLQQNDKKLFHVKMKNSDGEIRHFLLKYQNIPQNESYGILSFEDVTELELFKLFDETKDTEDTTEATQRQMFHLLEIIKQNKAKLEIHNFYKGLSITNNCTIEKVQERSIIIKTSYLQQKALQYEQKVYLMSEALPMVIECLKVSSINFEHQTVLLESLHFVKTSPLMRKTIRVAPKATHSVSLVVGDYVFKNEISIADISLDAVRLQFKALPAGLEEGVKVTIDLVLMKDEKPLEIKTEAVLLKKVALQESFEAVFRFEGVAKKELLQYITKRQMAIIREFKGLQNG